MASEKNQCGEYMDGFGDYLDGDWWLKGGGEETLLESGTVLYHHKRTSCSGNCCLHGTSEFASCKMPRSWRHDKQIIEHHCPHGIGHPCAAALAYAEKIGKDGDGIHGCDGCCVDNAAEVAAADPLVNGYMIFHLTGIVESLQESRGKIVQDLAILNERIIYLRRVNIVTMIACTIFASVLTAVFLK
jgi:hypothetical protein